MPAIFRFTEPRWVRLVKLKRSPVIAVTSASEPSITLDLEEAAHSMIVRACHKHDLLGLPPTSKTRRFEDLFYEDVIGV